METNVITMHNISGYVIPKLPSPVGGRIVISKNDGGIAESLATPTTSPEV